MTELASVLSSRASCQVARRADAHLSIHGNSRAAAAYLVNKYGGDKKQELYPECPVQRAHVDQRMYFDMGTFYKAFGDCVVS